MDPVDAVDASCVFGVLSNLGPKELARCCVLAKSWRDAAEDERLWEAHCKELWKDKVYVSKEVQDMHPKKAYLRSIQDSTRTAILPEELCIFDWSFRFRRVAGLHWMQNQCNSRMLRRFQPDGSITAPTNDPLWMQHEQWANRWRMRKSKLGKKGCYVQINHWPSLELKRSSDWGWSMRNQWVVYKARFAGTVGQQQQQQQQGEVEQAAEGDGEAGGSNEGGSGSGSDSDGEYSLTSDSSSGSEDEGDDSDAGDEEAGEAVASEDSDEDW